MLDFKQKKAVRPANGQVSEHREMAENAINKLVYQREGWYEGELNFKRVVMIPSTGKHEYRDTRLWRVVRQCQVRIAIIALSSIFVTVWIIAASFLLQRARTSILSI